MPILRVEANERLVLRPRWLQLVVWALGSIPFLLVGAVGWTSLLGGRANGLTWSMGLVGTFFGILALALALRCRLILTAQGFRIRWLWGGRLVPWSAVRRFEASADVSMGYPASGAIWLPRRMGAGEEGMLGQMRSAMHRRIPTFGGSQRFMLETLNSWLNRYSGPVAR